MFDIGFSELMVIAVLALIVLGPERLPKVARTVGHLVGRMQRYVNDVKSDISREMQLDEIKRFESTVNEAARALETTVTTEVASTESTLREAATSVEESARVTSPPDSPASAPAAGLAPVSGETPGNKPAG
jgi:sec-independent protein translocase protein TatB